MNTPEGQPQRGEQVLDTVQSEGLPYASHPAETGLLRHPPGEREELKLAADQPEPHITK